LLCSHVLLAQTPALTQLTPNYDNLARSLSINPNELKNKLNAPELKPINPIDLGQHYLLLSLANNYLVLPRLGLKNAERGLLELEGLTQPWLTHTLSLAKADAMDGMGETSKALPLANRAIEWAERNQHNRLLVDALSVRGTLHNTLLNSTTALVDLQRAYTLAPMDDPFIAKGGVAALIALVYEYRQEDKRAIPYFQEAVAYHKKNSRWMDYSSAIYGLGRANKNIGKLELGSSQLNESIEVAEKIGDEQGIAYGLRELGGLDVSLGNFEKAERLYDTALRIFEKSDNIYMLVDVGASLAEIQLKLNNPDRALNYIKGVEDRINPVSMPMHLFKVRNFKAKAYGLKKQYKKAYEEIMQSYPQRLKYLRKQHSKEFEVLKNEFEVEQLDIKNKVLNKTNELNQLKLKNETEKNRSLILYVVLSTIICILLLFILYRTKSSKKKYEKLSEIDFLTGLYNRRKIMELLDSQIDLATRHAVDLCVAVLDLDHFKKINDHFGHSVGDKVLVLFAELCQSNLRRTDLIGRIGGEEFVILLPHTSLSDGVKILDELRVKTLKIAERLALDSLSVSVSIGLAAAKLNSNSENVVRDADQALYSAKAQGRNQIAVA